VIRAERANFPVALMCRCLEVSCSGFYAWLKRSPSERAERDSSLADKIRVIHGRSRETYGSPRIHHDLVASGEVVGHKRVERIMRANGIAARFPRRRCTTTVRDESDAVAENILNREFTTTAPNVVWVGDITYIETREGWLYLAVLIDLFSRRVVGWSIADHLRTELPLAALRMAMGNRDFDGGLLHHSDRGCQYTSRIYQEELGLGRITASMSRAGNCHDNAVAESFNGTLKTELFFDLPVPETRKAAREAVEDYIELFYNRERRHSTIGNISPVEFEALYHQPAATMAA
jgi:transposase InsO family protein